MNIFSGDDLAAFSEYDTASPTSNSNAPTSIPSNQKHDAHHTSHGQASAAASDGGVKMEDYSRALAPISHKTPATDSAAVPVGHEPLQTPIRGGRNRNAHDVVITD